MGYSSYSIYNQSHHFHNMSSKIGFCGTSYSSNQAPNPLKLRKLTLQRSLAKLKALLRFNQNLSNQHLYNSIIRTKFSLNVYGFYKQYVPNRILYALDISGYNFHKLHLVEKKRKEK